MKADRIGLIAWIVAAFVAGWVVAYSQGLAEHRDLVERFQAMCRGGGP